MKYTNTIISIIIALSTLSPVSAYAAEVFSGKTPESAQYTPDAVLSSIGPVSITETVSINESAVPLYPTFESPADALHNMLNNEAILAIQKTYGFDSLSMSNWKEYAVACRKLQDSPSCPDWYQESDDRVWQAICFFDILENNEKNARAKGIVSSINTKSLGEMSLDIETLRIVLPAFSYELIADKVDRLNRLPEARSNFNVSKASDYALTYATSRNTNNYPSFDADCTNFASQILESGGEPQVPASTNPTSGWWHQKVFSGHSWSHAWSLADSFMKFFHATSPFGADHNKFSLYLQEGDFIALDDSRDGDWDHVGYVVACGNGIMSEGYRDYHVAQHTPDYHLDVSDSKNHWETHNGKANYGMFRR